MDGRIVNKGKFKGPTDRQTDWWMDGRIVNKGKFKGPTPNVSESNNRNSVSLDVLRINFISEVHNQ